MIKKGKSPKKIDPLRPFRRGSLLEYGGLKPILPFLGEGSDAACRVVFWPSRLAPMETYSFNHDAARRVATVFEKWGCLIRTHLPEEPLKIDPLRAFRRGSPFGMWRFKIYFPVSRRR